NAGGCHGKASGQNGFKLSLFGFDSDFDFAALTREARGRRIFFSAPDESLLLRKAAGKAPHGGGKRLDPAGSDYQVIRRGGAAGAPASPPGAPPGGEVGVSPPPGVVRCPPPPPPPPRGGGGGTGHPPPPPPHGGGGRVRGERQQLAVVADYSDGSTRDVTRQAEFRSNLEVVATVEPDGLVKAGRQSGEAAIMARHMGFVAVFRALVPHGPPIADLPDFKPHNYVDELTLVKWKKLGLRPSPICDDATFLRRVTIDLCGRLPTAAEAVAFEEDRAADKRARLIDRLLDSPDYSAYFALKWGSV